MSPYPVDVSVTKLKQKTELARAGLSSKVIPFKASGNNNPTNVNSVAKQTAISKYSRIAPIIRW
jgi:hypothetical protein